VANKLDAQDWRVWVGVIGVFVVGSMIWKGFQPPAQEVVAWETDPALLQGSSDPTRPLTLVEFTAPGCIACEKMAREVFSQQAVADALDEFVCLRLNPYEHREAGRRFEIGAVPTFFVLDPRGQVLKARAGFMPVSEFLFFVKDAQRAYSSSGRSADRR
jgi:thioredoxin-related protein